MGTVLFFLIRMYPFTEMCLTLQVNQSLRCHHCSFTTALSSPQSGRLDHADRLFHSVAEAWRHCMNNPSDLKELVPEMYTTPEILSNSALKFGRHRHGIALGERQDGVTLDSVDLPPWAQGDAWEFIRLHRLALESDIVSSQLHSWIDLVRLSLPPTSSTLPPSPTSCYSRCLAQSSVALKLKQLTMCSIPSRTKAQWTYLLCQILWRERELLLKLPTLARHPLSYLRR